jgi:hypothetical protein
MPAHARRSGPLVERWREQLDIAGLSPVAGGSENHRLRELFAAPTFHGTEARMCAGTALALAVVVGRFLAPARDREASRG